MPPGKDPVARASGSRRCQRHSPALQWGGLNYLAHLYLAEDRAESRIGNLLGDFVTGRPESLKGRFPDAVLKGIVRHRAIDRFADSHRVNTALKAAVAPARRRFAGVIIDILYDHFLTLGWTGFSTVPFRSFIDTCNAELLARRELLPAELGRTLEERIADDWLGRYGSEAGLAEVFHRVALRHPGFAPIRDAVEDLRAKREVFAAGFTEFFPELRAWVAQLGPEAEAFL